MIYTKIPSRAFLVGTVPVEPDRMFARVVIQKRGGGEKESFSAQPVVAILLYEEYEDEDGGPSTKEECSYVNQREDVLVLDAEEGVITGTGYIINAESDDTMVWVEVFENGIRL